MNDFVLQESAGDGIVKLTLNDPDTRNALSTQAQWDAVVDACERIRRDPDVRCVVLTGAGSAFCAGGNVKDMQSKSGIASGDAYRIAEGYRNGIQRIPLALHGLDVPTIAAVNGPAIGAGCDLACMCDIRIAADKATFAESFVKVGIVPGDGGAWLLPRVIGLPRASMMAFTGDAIDAERALSWGLVAEVVPAAELERQVLALADRIAANPAHALRLTKRLMREGQHMRLDSLLELSAAYQALAHHTDDHLESVNALLQKRPPHFTGR